MKKTKRMVSSLVIISLIAGTAFTKDIFMASAAASQANIHLKINSKDVTKKTVSIEKGKSQKIKVVVPENQKAKLTFCSNKNNIVSVSKAGKINAKKAGIAKITVIAKVKKKKYTSWVKIRVISFNYNSEDVVPTVSPTITPEVSPTVLPTVTPEVLPSPSPTVSPTPTAEPTDVPSVSPSSSPEVESGMYDITLHINGQSFSAKLYKTEATALLMQKLPLSITMNELNGNEKYYYFSENFPTATERVSEIQAGDIKLYGSSCLVLFYKSFSTSYSYTSLGYIEHPERLAEVLGIGNVQVDITG